MYSMTWCARARACGSKFVSQTWYMPAPARLRPGRLRVLNDGLIDCVHLAVTHDTITTSLN